MVYLWLKSLRLGLVFVFVSVSVAVVVPRWRHRLTVSLCACVRCCVRNCLFPFLSFFTAFFVSLSLPLAFPRLRSISTVFDPKQLRIAFEKDRLTKTVKKIPRPRCREIVPLILQLPGATHQISGISWTRSCRELPNGRMIL